MSIDTALADFPRFPVRPAGPVSDEFRAEFDRAWDLAMACHHQERARHHQQMADYCRDILVARQRKLPQVPMEEWHALMGHFRTATAKRALHHRMARQFAEMSA